eukprot:1488992-Karenia_brevis.AAC.1
MFGQTAAVYSFLRFSRALSAIFKKIFLLTVVEFFDDFTQIEPAVLASSAQETIEGILGLLGWKVALGEKKRKPFSKRFISLGAEVDFENLVKEELVVRNKPGRVDQIVDTIRRALSCRALRTSDLLSVRGRVLYAEGQLFGRISAATCHMIAEWTRS